MLGVPDMPMFATPERIWRTIRDHSHSLRWRRARLKSPLIDYKIEYHHFRVRFELRRRIEHFSDQ
jgi:hypothetical protein